MSYSPRGSKESTPISIGRFHRKKVNLNLYVSIVSAVLQSSTTVRMGKA